MGGEGVDAVDWDLARRVANRAAARDPYSSAHYRDGLAPDFEEFTARAEDLVAASTGLRSAAGPARGRVTDRAGWIDANLSSFKRLLHPLTQKLGARMEGSAAPLARKLAGAELGMMLGWMSARVLGQYDLLVIEDENPGDQDIVYYVAPNVLSLEQRYAFDPRQFRLWLALHEVTHRAQFTGVVWMRPHFLSLVSEAMESVDPDPRQLLAGLRRLVEARRRGADPFADGGLTALMATDSQREVLHRVSGLMCLLEGHGDVTMDRAGRELIPSAGRFGRVLRQRRMAARGPAKVVQRLLGLDAKIKQYAQGERFIEAVEAAGGEGLLDRVWECPENLPTLAEIRAPEQWMARIGSSALAA